MAYYILACLLALQLSHLTQAQTYADLAGAQSAASNVEASGSGVGIFGGSLAQTGSSLGDLQLGSLAGLSNQLGSQAGALQLERLGSSQTGSEGGVFQVDSNLNSVVTYTNVVLRTLDVFQKSVIFRPVTRDVQVTEFVLSTATETLTSTITTPGSVNIIYDDKTERMTSTSTVTNTITGYNVVLNTAVANAALDWTVTVYSPSIHRVTTSRRFYLEFPVSKTQFSTTVTTITRTDSYIKYIVGYNTGYAPPSQTVYLA